MRKLMIVAMLVATATLANAQRGHDRNDDRRRENDNDRDERSDKYSRNGGNDKIDSYQREARRQIAYGIESGRITSRESRKLLREVEKIEAKENRYRRDGDLNSRERRDLVEDLAVLNRWIYREKRDGDRITYEDFDRNTRQNDRNDDRYNRRY